MTGAVLRIGARRLSGWTKVSVTASVEALSPAFRLSMSERSPGELGTRRVNPGDTAVVELDGETVITGFVDGVRPEYSANGHSIGVIGRDATGDLVDCSAAPEPGEWHNATLARIAEDLCAPFGIPVTAVPEGEPFRKFRVEMGETVFEALDRACRFRGVFARADGHGGLTFGPVATSRAEVRLERGTNILSAEANLSHEGRFSEYGLVGQQQGDDHLTPEACAHVSASTRDPGIRRFRPFLVVAEQPVTETEAIVRIRWERDVRAARARQITVRVRGWRERAEAGALWRPGRLVRIADDWLGLDLAMLVSAVTWRRDQAGTITVLTLMHERAFSRPPQAARSETFEETPWQNSRYDGGDLPQAEDEGERPREGASWVR